MVRRSVAVVFAIEACRYVAAMLRSAVANIVERDLTSYCELICLYLFPLFFLLGLWGFLVYAVLSSVRAPVA
jgi:hypothetical protein